MATAKDQIQKILDIQPDDSSYDEILREFAFSHMVDKGLTDMANGRIISNEEMKNRIQSWQK